MKRIFYTLTVLFVNISMQAQILKGDMNDDGNLSIEDVTLLANAILNPASKTYINSAEQFILDNQLTGTFTIGGVKRAFNAGVEINYLNLLPGKFSVSATKQVQFTKSNLYWDGSSFHFEEKQTDYPTEWDENHISHFGWAGLTNYQSGYASYMPYAIDFRYSNTYDKFWCGEENPLIVDGTNFLYTLKGGSSGEWYYLLNSRTNASNLYKYGVTVTNDGTSYSNCLIIAPDDFEGLLQSSYTLDEVNSLGLVCLPASGYRNDSSLSNVCSEGGYWSATPNGNSTDCAYYLLFNSSSTNSALKSSVRYYARSLRLVRTVE